MMTFLALLCCTYLLAGAVLFIATRDIPEGWEDEGGFHMMWRNNAPEIVDVTCVWERGLGCAAA